jgi:hypothetical protein
VLKGIKVPRVTAFTRLKVLAGRVRIASRAGLKETAAVTQEDPVAARTCDGGCTRCVAPSVERAGCECSSVQP